MTGVEERAVGRSTIRWDGPESASLTVILAPGDRGRVEDPVARALAESLAGAGVRVARFDAAVTAPGEQAQRDVPLERRIREVAKRVKSRTLVLAGISRGARVSAGLVQELGAVALVGFAYPFHDRLDPDPQGRVERLVAAGVPTLICQGTRDAHGNREQVRGYRLPECVRLHWLADANHALQPRPHAQYSQEELLAETVEVMIKFIRGLPSGSP